MTGQQAGFGFRRAAFSGPGTRNPGPGFEAPWDMGLDANRVTSAQKPSTKRIASLRPSRCTLVSPESRVPGPGPRKNGFTLLEIIVVMLIIGIMATFAMLSIGGRSSDDRLQAEASRLRKVMALAADETLFKGEQLGLLVETNGYRLLALGSGGWTPYTGGAALRPHPVPEPIVMTLTVEGRPVPLHDAQTQAEPEDDDDEPPSDGRLDLSDGDGNSNGPAPQIMVLSSGEMTPFSLEFSVPDQPSRYRVEGDLMGRVKSGKVDEGDDASGRP